jgi:hypothetical protein
MVPMQNPMAHSLSFALGSSILDEWGSQIIPGGPFLNAWKCGKLKNVGRAIRGRPTLLTITRGGWSSWWTTYEWNFRSSMSSTKHVGDLGMNSYAHWITFSGTRLIHIHRNQWACEPIKTTPTCTSSLIQVLICCHPDKTIGLESPNGGTFSNKYAYWCICVYHKCYTTWINS